MVRVWRGGPRYSLSVAAPFVLRCLNSRTITPFPHPPHRTGHAKLPHSALGQDSMPLHTKGHPHYTRPSHRTVYPDVHRSSVMHITDNATTWEVTGFRARKSGSSFASVCDTFCISHTLHGVHQGCPNLRCVVTFSTRPEPRPLPSTGITRLPQYYGPLRHPIAPPLTVTGLRLIAMTDHAIGLPVLRAFPLCACCRHHPGTAHTQLRHST